MAPDLSRREGWGRQLPPVKPGRGGLKTNGSILKKREEGRFHSLRNLLSVFCVPGTFLSTRDISVNKTDRNPYLHIAFDPCGGRQIRSLTKEKIV